jgi:hypothetical protein
MLKICVLFQFNLTFLHNEMQLIPLLFISCARFKTEASLGADTTLEYITSATCLAGINQSVEEFSEYFEA